MPDAAPYRSGGQAQYVPRALPDDLGELFAATRHGALDEIRGARESAPGRGIHLMTIRLRGEDEFLGYCGLIIGRASIDEPEIAYEMLRSAHGRGYATEAGAAIVEAAAATGRTRLWSTVGTWNAPSFRVLEKLGFRRDRTTPGERGDVVWNVLDL